MSTQIEQLSALERRFTMSIPVAAIASETETRIKRLARTVKMSGFRPGKVPVKMVASTYGPQVRSEVLSDEVNKSFGAVVEANKLRVAGYHGLLVGETLVRSADPAAAVREMYS